MLPFDLRTLLTQLLVVVFATTCLLHPPMMARDARPATDCHAMGAAHSEHAAHADHLATPEPAAPVPMRLDCPLSTLPPLPAMSEARDGRVALAWRYTMRAPVPPHTATLSPAEPPPRAIG